MITQKIRNTIYCRDFDRCARCGRVDNRSIQHRKRRGMGGCKTAEMSSLSNLIQLCIECNQRCTADLQADSYIFGWAVKTWQNPLHVPVFYAWLRQWRVLDNLGGFEVLNAKQAERMMS